MSNPPTTSATATRLSPQGLRTLGYAIALASMTGLLAYGCEKAESQKQPAPVAAQPNPGATKPGATMPGAQPTKTPAADPAKPVEIGANMVQGEKPAPGKEPDPNAPALAPKPKPIPHEDLAQDAKPLSEFNTPTGVIVQDFKMGKGAFTLPKALVTVHFVLHVKEGWKKIQSTYDDGAPEINLLDEVVLGMADGLVGMQPGATRRIIVPPERGFGAKGAKDQDGAMVIPPNATLVYDVDMISNKQSVVEGSPYKPAAPKFNPAPKDDAKPGK